MKNVKNIHWEISEANQRLQQDFDVAWWAFLIAALDYKEISFDAVKQEIVFPEYIPIKNLLADLLEQIRQETIAARQCGVCRQYFDINKNDGIFGDEENLERFICRHCAQSLSAWDFYQHHLKV